MSRFHASIVTSLLLAALWIQESHQRPHEPCPAWICKLGGRHGVEAAGGIEPRVIETRPSITRTSKGIVVNSDIEIIYVAGGSNTPCLPDYQSGQDNKLNCNSGGIGVIEPGMGESGPSLTKVDVENERVPPISADTQEANKGQKGSNKGQEGLPKGKENGAKPGGGFIGIQPVYIVGAPDIPCPPGYMAGPDNKCREIEE